MSREGKTKKKLSQLQIHKYAKSRLGVPAEHGMTSFQYACKALEIDGKPLPSATTWKKWTLQNADFIAQEAAKIQPEQKKINRQSFAVIAAKQALNAAKKRSKLTAYTGPDPVQKSAESRVKAFQAKSSIDPVSDAFLSSFEWRSVRMMALKKHGARCQCCGASPASGAVMHVDHIKPRKIFPHLALDVENLQVLCGECNHGKGNWDMTDWRLKVSNT